MRDDIKPIQTHSDEGHPLVLSSRISDISLSTIFTDRDGDFHDMCFNMVPKWRDPSVVSQVVYNVLSAILGQDNFTNETINECRSLIPRDKPASIDTFDYRPRLTGIISSKSENTPYLVMDTQEVTTTCRYPKGQVAMGFSTVTSQQPDDFSKKLIIPLILAIHIAQNPEADEIYQTVLNTRKDKRDILSVLPSIARQTLK